MFYDMMGSAANVSEYFGECCPCFRSYGKCCHVLDMKGNDANISGYEKCCQCFMIWCGGSAANVQDMVGTAVQVSGKCFECFMILWEVLSML